MTGELQNCNLPIADKFLLNSGAAVNLLKRCAGMCEHLQSMRSRM
jgi:hypothetical protein